MEEKLRQALEEIKELTKSLIDFNPTYEKIYKIACEALENEN